MAFYPNDMLSSAYLIGAVNERPSKEAIRQQYRAKDFFPWEEVPERQVIYDIMVAENNLAGFYGPRGQAIPGDDVLFSTEVATLADIKASRHLDSWAVQTLRDPGMPAVYKSGGSANSVKAMQARIKDHINKRLAWCNETVDAQLEYIAMQALRGTVTWPPVDNDGNAISPAMPHWNANMTISIDVGLPSAQNQAATTLSGFNSRTGSGLAWTNANATPFNDLDIIEEYMAETFGVRMRGGRILMSTVDLGYMSRTTSVQNIILGANKEQPGTRGFADKDSVKLYVQTRFGWNIELYDAQWTYRTHVPTTKPTINRVNFLPKGTIIIIPGEGSIGTMMTAPQESEPGGRWVYQKMGWKYQDPKPPYDIELGVNAVAWPRFSANLDWFVLDTRN